MAITAFRIGCRRPKRVLENAKCTCAQGAQDGVDMKQIGSYEIYKITNQIIHRSKAAVHTIINGPLVISSLRDKTKIFDSIFASMLDEKIYTLSYLSRLTENNPRNIFISTLELSKLKPRP